MSSWSKDLVSIPSPNLNSAVVTFHHTGNIFLANSAYLQARPTLMALMVANDIPVEKKSRQLGNLAKAIDLHKLSIVDEHLHFILHYCHIRSHLFCTCMSYGALACHMHLLHVFCADLRLETFCQSVVRQGLRLGNRAEPGFISSSCRVSQKIAYGTLRARLGN